MSIRYETSVHIDATPARVWEVMSDIERWHEWAPAVRSIRRHDSGPLVVGSAATLHLQRAPTARWTVIELEDGRSFTWESDARVKAVAWHRVEPDGDGARATLGIEAPGVVATLLWPFIMPVFRGNVKAEAAGLKRKCETPV